MAITSDIDTRRAIEAVVSVRIPNGADGDLATEAEQRLSRVEGVTDVAVEAMHGLDPGLSATIVTVKVSVRMAGDVDSPAEMDLFAEAVGVEGAKDGSA